MVIDAETELRPLTPDDAGMVFDLIQRDRAHLDRWLRWSGRIRSLEDTRALINRFAGKTAAGDGFHAGIWLKQTLTGGLVCHGIKRESRKSEIGYWLGSQYTGRGLATRASIAALDYLFSVENLHRVEIQCAVDNARSRAIPERLGFTFEGVLRESEWLTDRYADHAIYSILDHEWAARGGVQPS